MKKAQILSAIALAFALGVVTPVASTYAADTTSRAGELVAPTATAAEVNTAISKVEGYSEYKKYLALVNAVEAAKGNGTTAVTLPAASTITNEITKIDANYAPAANITLATAVANAKAVSNYNNWVAVYNALQDNANIAPNAQRDAIIAAVQKIYPNYNAGTNPTLESVKDDITGTTNTSTAELRTAYTNYSGLIEAVNAATNAMTVETNLRNALVGAGKSQAEVNALTTIATLQTAAEGYPGYTEYNTLVSAVNTAKNGVEAGDTTANRNFITSINDNLKAATAVAPGTQLSLDDLVATDPGTNQPTNPDQPTNPENPDDNKPTTPTTPPTGVVDSSDNNASTTVSIIAGLATALTAAGAGIVAYRNARRSSDKEA